METLSLLATRLTGWVAGVSVADWLQGATILCVVCVLAYVVRRLEMVEWQMHWMDGRQDMADEEILAIRDKVEQHERMLRHMAAMRAAKEAKKLAKTA